MTDTPFRLAGSPFTQDWSNTGLITTSDDWSGVPSVIGYRGDELTGSTGTDPQTIVADGTGVIDVNANQSNPNTFSTGGVAEFEITNPVVALNGSGTADAPFLLIYLNTTGVENISVSYNLRDVDGSTDDAVQQVALQYRVGATGNFVNIPAGYVADASTGPNLATQVTPVSATLPPEAANQPQVQLRIITTNAGGNDESIGVDDINIAGTPINGGGGTPIVSIAATDSTASEAGTDPGTFTITRSTSDITAPLTVNYTVTGQADGADYTPTLDGTATIAAGESSVDITITPVEDSDVEGNEAVTLTLSDSADYDPNPAADNATVTIADNDTPPPVTRIRDIQGAAQTSPLAGQNVSNVIGIVTAVRSNGFYYQDPTSDGDDRTSEGIFVFGSALGVSIGNSVSVNGTVSEFIPGGPSTGNLSITQITRPTITQIASLGAIAPTVIGIGGRTPPTEVIDNDSFSDFDPAQDGIDFYESLEGMLVQVNNAVAVGPTNNFGEIPVLADNGDGASGRTTRGGIRVQPGDFNPERIIIDDAIVLSEPQVNVGDQFNGSITGVIDYSFGNFKLLNTASLPGTSGNLARETTNLTGAANQLTLATFNVENLDPGDGAPKFERLASNIVNNLSSPDIINLEEIQDNNGPTNDSVVDANVTYQTLINAIAAAGGPTYEFRQVNPVDDQDGGEPGGNIRVGFLFNPDRVDFVDRPGGSPTTDTTVSGANDPALSNSPGRILDTDSTNGSAFDNSRKPLAGEFEFNGNTVFVIGNHFNSKGGDQPLFGRSQPPELSSEFQRRQQAQEVRDFVSDILTRDPNANVIVAGDLNDFEFSRPLEILENGEPGASDDLTNLVETIPGEDRYTFNFEGNSQVLDQILVSNNLRPNSEIDIVHFNSEFADQVSDHDPLVSRFTFAPPAPPTLSINDVTVTEGDSGTTQADFTVTLSRSSAETVTVEYATADNSATAGSDYTAETGTLTFSPGDSLTQAISIAVNGDTIDEADETFSLNLSNPSNAAIADNQGQGLGTINDDDSANNQTGTDANETFVASPETDNIDAKGGNDKVIARVSELQQNDSIDGGLGKDTFVLSAGTANDTVTIEVSNPIDQLQGLGDNAVVTNFEVFNLSNFDGSTTFIGGSQADEFLGGAGGDVASGNEGKDQLRGGDGDDTLNGNAGNDTLNGGAGEDTLTGGSGNDTFIVNSPTDEVIEAANEGLDTVRSYAPSFILSEQVENLNLLGNGPSQGTGNDLNNTIIGNNANNILKGAGGMDTLLGQGGNDQLVGGAGADILTGGRGADRFVFNSQTEGADRITDFATAVAGEQIEVSRGGFSTDLTAGQPIDSRQFRTGTSAGDADDRFIYTRSTGALFFDPDGNRAGGAGQTQFAALDTGLNLTSNDIFVFA